MGKRQTGLLHPALVYFIEQYKYAKLVYAPSFEKQNKNENTKSSVYTTNNITD